MSQDIVRHRMALVVTQGKYFKYDFHLYYVLLNPYIWTILALLPIILVLRKSSSKKDMTVNKAQEKAIPNRLKTVFLCPPHPKSLQIMCSTNGMHNVLWHEFSFDLKS